MSKKILFKKDARKALKRGLDIAVDAVKVTIGPKGRNVVIDRGFGTPTITNDGVSIVKEIELKDKTESMGAEIVKDVANKTNDLAGDGTTTAAILTQAIVDGGFKEADSGANVMGVKMGIESAAEKAVEILKGMAKPIKSTEEIVQVATISSESEEFGKKIAEAIDKVGKEGVVTVEESQSFGVESEVVEGMQFDKGYVSPYMITNAEAMKAEYADPLILITDKKISAVKDIVPVLEKVAEAGKKEVVIIAEDIEGEALATLVVNKLRGTFNTLAVKAPGYGDRKKEMLEDIAILTGGKVISEDVGLKLENTELAMLGRAHRVVATKDDTTIVDGKGKKADIKARVSQLRASLDQTDSKFDKEKIQERLGKLSGGVAVIKVGAATETEMKYKKLKIEDAVEATKAAIEEGVVVGGGGALIHTQAKIASGKIKAPSSDIESEFQAGVSVLLSALEIPLTQIVVNAGKKDSAKIVEEVKSGGESSGYDAGADKVVKDMFAVGILDPVKVVRTGLQNAASAAAILLTTEVSVAEEPKEEKEGGHDHGGMGGGMPGMM